MSETQELSGRVAIVTGASRGIGHTAQATLALCLKPPREQTGVIAYSYQFLDAIGRDTRSLDGDSVFQRRGVDARVPA